MALIELSAAERAYAFLAARGEDVSQLFIPNIIACQPDALAVFGNRIARGDGYQSLVKAFNGLISGSVCDLSASDFDKSLFDFARAQITPAGAAEPAKKLRNRRELAMNLPGDSYYVTHEAGKLFFRTITTGALTGLSIAVEVVCNFIPTLAQIPPDLEDAFISTLAERAIARDPVAAALASRESTEGTERR